MLSPIKCACLAFSICPTLYRRLYRRFLTNDVMDSYYSKLQGVRNYWCQESQKRKQKQKKATLELKVIIVNTVSVHGSQEEANVYYMPRLEYKQLSLGWSRDGQRSRCQGYMTLKIEWHSVAESSKILLFDPCFWHVY